MSCTKEEIERKRLAALQKRKSKSCQNAAQFSPPHKFNSPTPGYSSAPCNQPSRAGPVRSLINNGTKTFHPYSKPEVNFDNNVPVNKVVSGTVYLISEDRFEVNPSEFCTPLINIFKTIPSRNYGKY